MELTEPVESINNQLKDLFGIDTLSGLPIWRVSWSEDQLEKRLISVTDSGVQLLHPEVREVKKYNGFTKDRYVLEQLVLVPEANRPELPTTKMSYEPMWVFETDNGVYLPPRLDASKIIIDTLYERMGKKKVVKDPDADKSTAEQLHDKRLRVEKLQQQLFGDESGLDGAIVHGSGVGYGVKH